MIRRHPVPGFLVLTFAISWSVVLFSAATLVAGRGEKIGLLAMVLVGQFGPTLAALVMTAAARGRTGVRALLGSAVSWRQPPGLAAFALLFHPLLFGAAVAVTILRGAPAPDFAGGSAAGLAVTFLPTLALGLVFGGFSEELGWRGYLLPRLQKRFGFVGAAVAVGFLWSLWHLDPAHVEAGWRDGWSAFVALQAPVFGKYLSETIAMSIVMAWLFNRSRGSVALMILMHASSNASVTALHGLWFEKPATWSGTVTAAQWVAAAVFLVLALRAPLQVEDAADAAVATSPPAGTANGSSP